jgi:murein DD-endopeptidase MepM/ murein hydrolase activator NlpD
VIDTASRYGTLRRRIRDTYYGVQFLNSTGTPVYAAAAGDVEVAGDDSQVSYGPRLNMYGNLVIVKHSLPGISEPVYTLYAHLSEVSVKAEGDVEAGEQIGLVGMSGSTRGSTLYFEVRYGKNAYEAARNPELWLEPMTDETGDPMGALAGRLLDKQGNYVGVRNILVENLRTAAQGKLRPLYLRTYLDDAQMGLSPWGESFAASYLPEGTYQVSFWYGPDLYQREVEVQPGRLTFVNFEVK